MLAGARKTIEALAPDHQAILDAYINRRAGKADVGPTSPVIAPPELLDDDAAQPAPAADQAPPSASSDPLPKKLPNTPQEIREERLRRHKRQAEFEAANAVAAEPTPGSIDTAATMPDPPPAEITARKLPPPSAHSPRPEPSAPVETTSTSTPPEGAAGISPSSPAHAPKSGLDAPAPQSARGLNNPPLPTRPMTAQERHNEWFRLKKQQSEAAKLATAGPAPTPINPDPTALQPSAPAKSASNLSAQEPAPDVTSKRGRQ
jgi:hypothetical protein